MKSEYSINNESGIYQIRNVINNKIYVGSTINLIQRKKAHEYLLRKNKHKNDYLQNSWNKHGEDAFVFEVLEVVDDILFILVREQYYIDKTESFLRIHGYNIFPHAIKSGQKVPQETIDKISITLKKLDFAMRGSNHPNSKLIEDDVVKIRKLAKSDVTIKSIAEQYNIDLTVVYRIINGESWKSVSSNRVVRKNQKHILTTEDVVDIKNDLLNKVSSADLSRKYKVDHSTILLIKNGINWSHVAPELNTAGIKSNLPNKRKKLDIEKVKKIKLDLLLKKSTKSISENYNVSQRTIQEIKSGKSWNDVEIDKDT
jgi:group I intron endonuclease